jgi:hypothetical protein
MAFVVSRCRELYNAPLQERRDAWQKFGVSVHVAHQSAELLASDSPTPSRSSHPPSPPAAPQAVSAVWQWFEKWYSCQMLCSSRGGCSMHP